LSGGLRKVHQVTCGAEKASAVLSFRLLFDNESRSSPELMQTVAIAEKIFAISKEDLCSRSKRSEIVNAKEALIVSGRRLGATLAEMSDLIGINASTVSRRHDTARRRIADDDRLSRLVAKLIKQYERNRD